jgi:hypothetical protein
MSSLSQEARDLDGPRNRQRTYFLTTATHNRALRSHRVELVRTNSVGTTNKYVDTAKQAQQANRPNAPKKNDFQIIVPMPDGSERVYELKRTPSRNNSGYWVVEAPTELIPDHSRIFTSEFYGLAYGLLSMSRYYDDKPIKDKEQPATANGDPTQAGRAGEAAALLE